MGSSEGSESACLVIAIDRQADAAMPGGSESAVEAWLPRARPICLRLFLHWVFRADSRADCTAGSNMPIRTAMIAITTITSMSVNPVRPDALRLVIVHSSPRTSGAG